MKKTSVWVSVCVLLFYAVAVSSAADRRSVYTLGLELERQADLIAQSSFDHFRGRNNTISDEEQAVLFKSESFLASCRLFLRLAEEQSGYYGADYLRTNLYNAFMYLTRSFHDLEESMRRAGVMPFSMSGCRRILNKMDEEFSDWVSPDNLAYLHEKYVKAADATVYLIERKGPGLYVRRPFKSLESLFRYNYNLKRGKNPWKHLVEVSSETLEKMKIGPQIELNFEGCLIIEQSNRPVRGVYLIENGKKRVLTGPKVVERMGGWSKVFEVPVEIVAAYPEGEPIS